MVLYWLHIINPLNTHKSESSLLYINPSACCFSSRCGVADSAIQLAGYTAQRQDRTSNSGKSRGGGLCVYVINIWCTHTVAIDRHWSPDLGYVPIKCRPIYLPREFTVVLITAVYIPPDANANIALFYIAALAVSRASILMQCL